MGMMGRIWCYDEKNVIVIYTYIKNMICITTYNRWYIRIFIRTKKFILYLRMNLRLLKIIDNFYILQMYLATPHDFFDNFFILIHLVSFHKLTQLIKWFDYFFGFFYWRRRSQHHTNCQNPHQFHSKNNTYIRLHIFEWIFVIFS